MRKLKKIKKCLNITVAFIVLLMTLLPARLVHADTVSVPAAWPKVFSPYTNSDGTPILDPGADEHPIDVDITSGIDNGTGNLPSMFVASDGSNFFVRLRLKGNPYDRKGGFLSSVWLVKLAVNGEAKATIGLDGKSPHTDFVYVANANGTLDTPVYQTTTDGGDAVPGTRITQAENGQYFLDFQVPISKITEVAPEITPSTAVSFFFGTSKAANLSVINKEWMDTASSHGNAVSFSNLSEFALTEQPLAITIDGGKSKEYKSPNYRLTGTSSISTGNVSINLDGTSYPADIIDNVWSLDIPSKLTQTNGTYIATASVTSDGKTVTSTQEVVISTASTGMITINGGAAAITNSGTPTIGGTAGGANGSKVAISIDGGPETTTNANNGTWSTSINLPNPVEGKIYHLVARYTNSNGNSTLATTSQKLTYRGTAAAVTLPTVSIDPVITGDAIPTITGSSTNASIVELQIDGVTVGMPQPANDAWSVSLEKPFSTGTHVVKATAKNENGTAAATTSYVVSNTSITIDNGAYVTTNDNQPTIRGNTNAAEGSTIQVKITSKTTNVTETYSTTVQNGRWAQGYPLDRALTDGPYLVTASVGSTSENQELTIDTSTEVHIAVPVDGSSSSETRPTLSGSSENGATVELLIEDEVHHVLFIRNVTATQDSLNSSMGNWIYTLTQELPVGTYTLKATASDVNGNIAADTSVFNVTSPTVSIKSVDNISVDVPNGTSLEDAKAQLSPTVLVTLVDERQALVPINWAENSSPVFDGEKGGTFVFQGTFGEFPEGIDNNQMVSAPTGTIHVALPKSIANVKNVTKTVMYGTTEEDAKLALGETVEVTLDDGNPLAVPIIWSESSSPSYDGLTPGDYVFTGTFGELPPGYDNRSQVAAPTGTVTVLPAPTKSIKKVTDVTINVVNGTTVEEARAALGQAVEVDLEDGTKQSVPINWSETSSPSYDGTKAGTYLFTGTFGTLPAGLDNLDGVTAPKGFVVVSAPITKAIKSTTPTITVTVANGTDKTTATQSLGDSVTVTLADNSQILVPITWSEDSSPSYEGTKAGTYEFTATFGTLPAGISNPNQVQAPTGIVMVEKPVTYSINRVQDFTQTVVRGTSLEEAKKALGTFVSVELENGDQASVPITWSMDSSPSYEGNTPGQYVFAGSFGTLPEGVDNDEEVAAPKGTIQILNNEANIVTYQFPEQTGPALINQDAGSIRVQVKYGTKLDSLVAEFTLSKNAKGAKINGIDQVSKETPNDFSKIVIYTVIAEDGTEKQWTVTAIVQEKTASPNVAGVVRAGNTEINGTSEPNAKISVTLNGQVIGTTQANDSGNWTFEVDETLVLNQEDILTLTAEVDGKAVSDVKEIVVARALSDQKQIISTQYGQVDSANNVIGVPAVTKVSAFVDGLAVSEFARVVIIDKMTNEIVANQDAVNVSDDMLIRVVAENGTASDHTITTVLSMVSVNDVAKTVPYGTELEVAKSNLSENVEVTLEDGSTVWVPVTWSKDSSPAYAGEVPGNYVFIGNFGTLPPGVDNAKNVSAPTGTITVAEPETITIQSVSDVAITVPNGTSVEQAKSALGQGVEVILEDGSKAVVPIVWSESSSPGYDGNTAGDYVFTGTFGILPNGMDNKNDVAAPTGTVKVEEPLTVSLKKAEDVTKTVTRGTSIDQAREALGQSVTVELENGVQIQIPVIWSEDSTPLYDAQRVGEYRFTGSFGTLPKGIDNKNDINSPTGTIRILNNEAEMVTYQLENQVKPAVIDQESGTITVQVKYGTELEGLIAQFALSKNAQGAKVDDVNQISNETPNDFSKDVAYVVTAEDGTVKTWTVKVTVQEKTHSPIVSGVVRAGDTQIHGVSEPNALVTVILNGEEVGTIIADNEGNWMYDLDEHTVLSKDDVLGFTAHVEGKVVSEGTEVTVQRALSGENQILSTQYGNVNDANNVVAVPVDTSVSDFIAGLVVSKYAIVEMVYQDTNETVGAQDVVTTQMVIRVIAENGSVSTHTISIIQEVKLTLTSNPKSIVGDGQSQAALKAVITDKNGKAISGVDVYFSTEIGSLSMEKAVTDENGEAAVTLTAPVIEGTESVVKQARASVNDPAKGIMAEDEISITFQPPVIVGQVLDASGHPIVNAIVWVVVDGVQIETVTDGDGNYSLVVPRSGQYTVYIKADMLVNGQVITSTFTQEAQVQSNGQSQEYKTERKVSGKLLMETRDKEIISIQELFPESHLQVHVLNDSAGAIKASIDQDGNYELTGFESGQTYQVVFNVEMDGMVLAGKLAEVTVGTDGQIILQNELIDPFGMVSDSVTGEPVQGVNMKVYWADTDFNRNNGHEPNTLVELPELPNFLPNQNLNPQMTSEAVSVYEGLGNYAWMLYANGDYYITGEKEGYDKYDSREDFSTNTELGDSWIKDGVIHIGQTILRYDMMMDVVDNSEVPGDSGSPGEPGTGEEPTTGVPSTETPSTEVPSSGDSSNEEPSKEVPADEKEGTDTSEPTKVSIPADKKQETKSNKLPKTATQTYNLLFMGLLMTSLGMVLMLARKKRATQKHADSSIVS